jgi:hypothetical protein
LRGSGASRFISWLRDTFGDDAPRKDTAGVAHPANTSEIIAIVATVLQLRFIEDAPVQGTLGPLKLAMIFL